MDVWHFRACIAVAIEWAVYTNYEAYDGYNSMLHWRGSIAYNGFEK